MNSTGTTNSYAMVHLWRACCLYHPGRLRRLSSSTLYVTFACVILFVIVLTLLVDYFPFSDNNITPNFIHLYQEISSFNHPKISENHDPSVTKMPTVLERSLKFQPKSSEDASLKDYLMTMSSTSSSSQSKVQVESYNLRQGIFALDFRYKNTIWDTSQRNTDRILDQISYVPTRINSSAQMVIYIAAMSGSQGIALGNKQFENDQCLVSNCYIIKDLTKQYPDLTKTHVNAVITSKTVDELLWQHRRPEDVWIFYTLESPLHDTHSRLPTSSFNWTASYQHDSTIVTPYAKWVPIHNQTSNNYYDFPKAFNESTGTQNFTSKHNYARRKPGMAAILLSNCGSSAKHRTKVLHELQKYITVDVYGRCGKPCGEDERCFSKIRRYKFYLAFENGNCPEYITEKLFRNALSNDVIPVVYGAPTEDYARIAPPSSYIHVDSFPSIQQLAEYLKILDQNDDLYNTYFRWKDTGTFINTKFWCRVCAMLNDLDKPRLQATDTDGWRRKPEECISPNE